MIRVEHLSRRIPPQTTVLDDISFTIEPGELIGIVGASGSGKTSLLRCLALKDRWSGGKFHVDGIDIFGAGLSGKRKIRREWAYLEQNPVLSMSRTALKNVLIGRFHQTPIWRMATGMVRSDDYMGAMDVLEQLGLLDKAHQKAEQLSGGERQRVAIARALVHGANVILADEPTSGLDPKAAESVFEHLRELCRRQRATAIVVFHQLELAERYATRIWGLASGKLVVDVGGRRLTHREKELFY
ncbi:MULTISPECIES: phosphonate ABC transporter ATP-binding protein [unclassified Paenibacillus]|uniref:phosphonate ABC transporter ATP-binding protein n=1 Tax=unclassified Paenibacillus TaxID=185978 RepID=UPI001C11F734|nr:MULTISPECIES: ATP-binding cassette domain-containing protein [unclassified Paenibacillus]MBU5443192.1 ATP-binding cassette domain-containing protein [Paenibacillus sp. MSJ-34]CAH0121407.1 Glutamine transport ATP-binding protein GlnQ [Paenibacillus sp. CECT 9249]